MAEQFHEKVRFAERRRLLLSNPHKGCATFQRFNGDPLNQGTRWSEEGPLAFPPADREIAERLGAREMLFWEADYIDSRPADAFAALKEAIRSYRERES